MTDSSGFDDRSENDSSTHRGQLEADGGEAGAPIDTEEARRRPYVESQVVMATVRLISPFVLTYGVFVTLHGADSPGGGFQGGVIMAATVVMLAFSFGIQPTREWVDDSALLGLVAGGVALFAVAILTPMAFDGAALELVVLESTTTVAVKWWVEMVEVAIGMMVAGVVVGLFFVISSGVFGTDEADREGDR